MTTLYRGAQDSVGGGPTDSDMVVFGARRIAPGTRPHWRWTGPGVRLRPTCGLLAVLRSAACATQAETIGPSPSELSGRPGGARSARPVHHVPPVPGNLLDRAARPRWFLRRRPRAKRSARESGCAIAAIRVGVERLSTRARTEGGAQACSYRTNSRHKRVCHGPGCAGDCGMPYSSAP
jgi:hypothetical protein